MARSIAPLRVFQLKITLASVSPPIWRRVAVPGHIPLSQLHEVVQRAFGWENYHLHQFTFGGVHYGVPSSDDFEEVRDERRVVLDHLFAQPKDKLLYEYDFGDGWAHRVVLEKITMGPLAKVVCLAGKRRCPPEDCGGPWGYRELLDAMADPAHERHAELMGWTGGRFDPAAFDLDGVNDRLGQLKVK